MVVQCLYLSFSQRLVCCSVKMGLDQGIVFEQFASLFSKLGRRPPGFGHSSRYG